MRECLVSGWLCATARRGGVANSERGTNWGCGYGAVREPGHAHRP